MYGALHDRTGTYTVATEISVALFVVSALLFLALGPALRGAENAAHVAGDAAPASALAARR